MQGWHQQGMVGTSEREITVCGMNKIESRMHSFCWTGVQAETIKCPFLEMFYCYELMLMLTVCQYMKGTDTSTQKDDE